MHEYIDTMASMRAVADGCRQGDLSAARRAKAFLTATLTDLEEWETAKTLSLYLGTGLRDRLEKEVSAGRGGDREETDGPSVEGTAILVGELVAKAKAGDWQELHEFITAFVRAAEGLSLGFFLDGVYHLYKHTYERAN